MSVAIDLRHFSKIADDRDFVSKLYSEQSVKVMPLSAIGSGLAGFRLLICAPEQFYTDFLNRLEEFV